MEQLKTALMKANPDLTGDEPLVVSCCICTMTMWWISETAVTDGDGIYCASCAKDVQSPVQVPFWATHWTAIDVAKSFPLDVPQTIELIQIFSNWGMAPLSESWKYMSEPLRAALTEGWSTWAGSSNLN